MKNEIERNFESLLYKTTKQQLKEVNRDPKHHLRHNY